MLEERRHIAILFSDIVGYTSLMGSDAVYCAIEIQKAGNENPTNADSPTWDDYN